SIPWGDGCSGRSVTALSRLVSAPCANSHFMNAYQQASKIREIDKQKSPRMCAGSRVQVRLSGLGFLLAVYLGLNLGFYLGRYLSFLGEGTTIVGVHQDGFELGDQRVARVGAGALVIECFQRQLVNLGQEVCFVHASFADGGRDA